MRKYFYISYWSIIAVILSGCSNCDGVGGYTEVVPGDIYLTSQSANTGTGCIYTLNSDGRDVRAISENSTLISAPSESGYLLFRTIDNGSSVVRVYDIMKESVKTAALPEAFASTAAAGAISPDGKSCILESSSPSGAISIINLTTGETKELQHSALLDVSPVFSPKGASAVYISSDKKIVIINMNDGSEKIISPTGEPANYAFDLFTIDDENIYIPYKSGDYYKISRISQESGAEIILQMQNAGKYPAFSAGQNALVYTDAEGNLRRAVFSGASSVSPTEDVVFYSVNPDEACKADGWSSTRNSVVFTVVKKDSGSKGAGSFFVYNFNTGKSVYLFSNVTAGFWY